MVRKGNKQVRMKYKEEGREMGKYKEEVGEGKQKSAVEENTSFGLLGKPSWHIRKDTNGVSST